MELLEHTVNLESLCSPHLRPLVVFLLPHRRR